MDRTLATSEEVLDCSKRLMEVLDVLYNKDGESYAHSLKSIITYLTAHSTSSRQDVLQNVVEEVLLVLREGGLLYAFLLHITNMFFYIAQADFRSAFLGVFFALMDNAEKTLEPTITVIAAALVCEYVNSSPVSPSRLLQVLSTQLPSYNGVSIQCHVSCRIADGMGLSGDTGSLFTSYDSLDRVL